MLPTGMAKMWAKFGISDHRLADMKYLSEGLPAFIFAKGPSFGPTYPISQAMTKDALRICVNETVRRVPMPHFCVTNDDTQRPYLRSLKEIQFTLFVGCKHPAWPEPKNSLDLAFILAGELGIKKIYGVGLDSGWPGGLGDGNGFDYEFKSGPGKPGSQVSERVKDACLSRVDSYGMELELYRPGNEQETRH